MVRRLRSLIVVLIVIIIVLISLVGWNMVKLRAFEGIESGDYISVEQCLQAFDERFVGANITVSPIDKGLWSND